MLGLNQEAYLSPGKDVLRMSAETRKLQFWDWKGCIPKNPQDQLLTTRSIGEVDFWFQAYTLSRVEMIATHVIQNHPWWLCYIGDLPMAYQDREPTGTWSVLSYLSIMFEPYRFRGFLSCPIIIIHTCLLVSLLILRPSTTQIDKAKECRKWQLEVESNYMEAGSMKKALSCSSSRSDSNLSISAHQYSATVYHRDLFNP